jgi:hypothetical protein
MTKNLLDFENRLKQAVRAFWRGRNKAAARQKLSGRLDQGNRSAVTAGKNMDGFRDMVLDIVARYAPDGTEVHLNKSFVVLPGFFRPTKQWDILITYRDRLLAVLELKSLCGPSFGNNANNRCEEALGSACDFRKAQSEGLFGRGATPFLGYFILIEDANASRTAVSAKSAHFPTDPIFHQSSYQERMKILCERMMENQLYSSAAVLAAPAGTSGSYMNLSQQSSIKTLLAKLAGHLAGETSATNDDGALVMEGKNPHAGLLDGPMFQPLDDD